MGAMVTLVLVPLGIMPFLSIIIIIIFLTVVFFYAVMSKKLKPNKVLFLALKAGVNRS